MYDYLVSLRQRLCQHDYEVLWSNHNEPRTGYRCRNCGHTTTE